MSCARRCPLPAAVLLGVNAHRSGQSWLGLWVFAAAAAPALAGTALAGWEARLTAGRVW